ncbi:hypothetical protein CDD81_6146 [Ophiocordyceps australis]|uniref:Rhodopsin domain-containing protein n=1 Tax=Ophiocordyceps australis TaxID=1399860 RepID=A0A2C5X9N1_9HYPO|nr:hypothetical protein CDD81_6146 [Ophiocordyceps australis]
MAVMAPLTRVTPGSENHKLQNIVVHSLCLTAVTLVVMMRLYTRIRITRATMGLDDYCCLCSYCLTIAYSAMVIKSFTMGMGSHMWDVPSGSFPVALMYIDIASYIYIVLTGSIKLTFLLFYRRIFAQQGMARLLIDLGIGFVSCLSTVLFLVNLFSCTPIQRTWDASTPGHCLNRVPIAYVSAASSAVTDFYVLLLPLPLIWRLNLHLARKLRAMAVFGLGLLACIASLIRLALTGLLQDDVVDATWIMSKFIVWATVEVYVGIICACLMLLPAFISHVVPQAANKAVSHLWARVLGCLSRQAPDANKYPTINLQP